MDERHPVSIWGYQEWKTHATFSENGLVEGAFRMVHSSNVVVKNVIAVEIRDSRQGQKREMNNIFQFAAGAQSKYSYTMPSFFLKYSVLMRRRRGTMISLP